MGWPRPRPGLALWTLGGDSWFFVLRVLGFLAPRWSCWFAGLAVETSDGETVIVGPVDDQAALHGLLARIRDLGLPLLGLRVVDG